MLRLPTHHRYHNTHTTHTTCAQHAQHTGHTPHHTHNTQHNTYTTHTQYTYDTQAHVLVRLMHQKPIDNSNHISMQHLYRKTHSTKSIIFSSKISAQVLLTNYISLPLSLSPAPDFAQYLPHVGCVCSAFCHVFLVSHVTNVGWTFV